MRIKHAIIFASLITIIIVNLCVLSSFSAEKSARQTAIIGRIIDGDTLVLADSTKIRLVNINSPEKNVPSYILAMNYLGQFENKTVYLDNLGADKYQRTLARIYSQDGRYINLELVRSGLASKFLVEKSELSLFSTAESNAIASSKGIWNNSVHYGCLSSQIDKYKEIVLIINNCPQINFKDFTLKDESRKTYKFSEMQFSRIILRSGSGQDNFTDIFWNQQTDVWNNDRDTLYLFDNESRIVHYNSYGY